jgi:hypothetical protein
LADVPHRSAFGVKADIAVLGLLGLAQEAKSVCKQRYAAVVSAA